MKKRTVNIQLNQSGIGSIVIDGVDVSMFTNRIEIVSDVNDGSNHIKLSIPEVALIFGATDIEAHAKVVDMLDDEERKLLLEKHRNQNDLG